MVNFIPRPLYPTKEPQYLLNRLCGPPSWTGCTGGTLVSARIEPHTVQPSHYTDFAIPVLVYELGSNQILDRHITPAVIFWKEA